MGLLDGLISAGANILGGIMGRDSAEDINNQNIQNQREFATNALT